MAPARAVAPASPIRKGPASPSSRPAPTPPEPSLSARGRCPRQAVGGEGRDEQGRAEKKHGGATPASRLESFGKVSCWNDGGGGGGDAGLVAAAGGECDAEQGRGWEEAGGVPVPREPSYDSLVYQTTRP